MFVLVGVMTPSNIGCSTFGKRILPLMKSRLAVPYWSYLFIISLIVGIILTWHSNVCVIVWEMMLLCLAAGYCWKVLFSHCIPTHSMCCRRCLGCM